MNIISLFPGVVNAPYKQDGNLSNWPFQADFMGQFFLKFLIFLFVLVVTYYALKHFSKFYKKRVFGKNIEILEVISLNVGKSLYLIRVGIEYYLISVTKDRVEYMTKIDANTINTDVYKENEFSAEAKFGDYFNNILNKYSARPRKKIGDNSDENSDER